MVLATVTREPNPDDHWAHRPWEGGPGIDLEVRRPAAELVEDVFGVACQVVPDPLTATPMIVPLSRSARQRPAT